MKNMHMPGSLMLAMAICLMSFSSCNYFYVFIMSKPVKENVGKWRTEKYKVVVQRRQDYVGPPYYHLKIREKKVAGLYLKKVSPASASVISHRLCFIKLQVRSDTLTFDTCRRK